MDKTIKRDLWSCNMRRPDHDIEMLTRLGFRDVQLKDNLNRKLLFTLNHLKHGHGGRQFLVTGVK
jgi:hypothetical protein